MKVAVIQVNATANKKENIKRDLALIRRAVARKAAFILLPEAFSYRGKADARKGFSDMAEAIPGPSTIPLIETARKEKVFILAGSVCEKIPRKTKVYNTSVLIDARGRVAAKYRKVHLFDAKIGKVRIKESQHCAAGEKTSLADIGCWKAGMSICYDLRFPGLYRQYASKGVEIFCVPSAFTKATGQLHWEVLLRARAIEQRCYVLAPNQTGRDGRGVASYGNSMIVDPRGNVLARASGDKEGIIYANLDKTLIRRARKLLGS
jgi:predicted amidohydrolase